jgi:hypothetical protein
VRDEGANLRALSIPPAAVVEWPMVLPVLAVQPMMRLPADQLRPGDILDHELVEVVEALDSTVFIQTSAQPAMVGRGRTFEVQRRCDGGCGREASYDRYGASLCLRCAIDADRVPDLDGGPDDYII